MLGDLRAAGIQHAHLNDLLVKFDSTESEVRMQILADQELDEALEPFRSELPP